IDAYEKESDETQDVKIKGTLYDSVDDCIVAYMKYAAEAGFVVRRSCQKRLRNRDVKQKYLVCNRKARAVFNLVPGSKKFVLNVFDTIHNYELKREEFKQAVDLLEQVFIVKAASVDEVSKSNYREFYDVNDTTKSYIWLLKAFIKAFGKAPSIVVTDQDGAMRNAIEVEFVGLKHRLCMRHSTQKLLAKICEKIYDETDFKEKLNKIVSNMYIGPKEFKYRWGKLMEGFNLENHSG
ncbi:protein FAR1-related sequence 5, partial [Tanacetum coccineum]